MEPGKFYVDETGARCSRVTVTQADVEAPACTAESRRIRGTSTVKGKGN